VLDQETHRVAQEVVQAEAQERGSGKLGKMIQMSIEKG